MSHAWYSSGERDEEGNIVRPAIYDKTEQEAKPQKETVSKNYPKEFENAFYIEGTNKRDYFFKDTPHYWEWERLRLYSQAVYKFYSAVLIELKKKYDITLPDWVCKDEKFNLDTLASDLREKEEKLIDRFKRSNKSLISRIEQHGPLKRLQQHGATAWLFYHVCKQNIKADFHIKAKQDIKSLDKETDALKLFAITTKGLRRHKISAVPEFLGPEYSLKNTKLATELYSNKETKIIDLKSILNKFIQEIDGCTTDDYNAINSDIYSKLEELAQDKIKLSLIKFYQNYKKMHTYCFRLKNIASAYYQGLTGRDSYIFRVDAGENSIDLYDKCVKYHIACCNLLDNIKDYDDYFKQDVEYLLKKLQDACLYSQKAYNNTNRYNVIAFDE